MSRSRNTETIIPLFFVIVVVFASFVINRRPITLRWVWALACAYFAAAFGPTPPDVTTLATSALAICIVVPWAAWSDRT